jgi:hypothetical protein
MNYQEIKTHFDRLVEGEPENVLALSHRGLQGACRGALNKACGGDDNRKLILKALVGVTSTKALTLNQWYALFRFVFPYENGEFVFKNAEGKWAGREELTAWCGAIMTHVLDQEGQTKMFDEALERAQGS